MSDDDPIGAAVKLLARLPGVGEKSARRMAYSLLASGPQFAKALGDAVASLPERVRKCSVCGTYTGRETCNICSDPQRTDDILCVVARPWELDALERAGSFRGRYHVLHTLLDPLSGLGPEQFPLDPLLARVESAHTSEVIVATPPTVEGEATALFLAEALRPLGVKLSRIASGVPHGGDLEFVDPITLGRALEGRRGL
ncbi:MAG: recombination protein RecR [Myxococcales bacterium]|nr:recombination protein RecR [Myxococcales bacterium]